VLDRRWFDFYSPSKVIFESSPNKIAEEIKKFGNRFLIVNLRKENQNPAGLKNIRESVNSRSGGCIVHDEIIGIPDTEQIDSATFFAKRSHVDCIIAYGGIETMNAAKAISVLATNSFFAEDLFNPVLQTIQDPLPLITIPIEPCLGEEITAYFSIIDAQKGVRKIFSSEKVYPEMCFIDIGLCNYLKSDDTARISGALLASAIECIIAPQNNVLTDTLLFRVVELLANEMRGYYKDPGHDHTVRMMYWISIMIGTCLMDSPNGLNWSIAHVLGFKTKINFHQALSLVIPYVMEYNLTASANRFVQIARLMNEDISDVSVAEAAIQAIEAIRKLFTTVNLPTSLSEFYINKDHLSEISLEVSKFYSLISSSKRLGAQEIETILSTAL
jgi:alcohol dehydrogenase class IV